nr:MAG TPA: hypothetical protein [Caudoviricetes sp.]
MVSFESSSILKMGYSNFVVDRRLRLSLAHWCLPPLF